MKASYKLVRYAMIALGLAVMAGSAQAQGFGPLFAPQAFSGDIRFSLDKTPTAVTVNVKRPLDEISQKVVAALNRDIPKAGLNFRGFRPYNVSIVRSTRPTIKALVVNNDIVLEYVLAGNTASATFTTPDIVDTNVPLFGRVHFGVDRAADPRVALTFDMTVRATITPQLHGAPKVKTVSVSVQNSRLRPANFSASVLNAANDFVSWVAGTNFRGLAEKAINAQGIRVNDPVSKELNALNTRLAPLTWNAKSVDVNMSSNRVNIIYSNAVPAPIYLR